MTKLISKIQYKNFEVGEFIEEKKRNYDETIDLIKKFPWNNQREKIVLDLTNPSITIQGIDGDFLKLAVFFNEKFVLHYINKEQILFTKSFVDLKDTYTYLKDYFSSAFHTTDFKKENTWLQHNLKHFISQDFNYTLTPKSAWRFLLSTSGIGLAYSIFVILIFSMLGGNHINWAGIFAVLLSMFFAGGGINLILFFNYYFYAKSKILIMSKGNDIFYYGDKDSPTKYDKKEIVQFTTTRNRSFENPISGFAVVKIEFADKTIIKIPNIIVDHFALEHKLSEQKKIGKGGFPFVRQ